MKCVAWTIALMSLTVRDAGAVWFSLPQEPGVCGVDLGAHCGRVVGAF